MESIWTLLDLVTQWKQGLYYLDKIFRNYTNTYIFGSETEPIYNNFLSVLFCVLNLSKLEDLVL